jgi:hypothetical protein
MSSSATSDSTMKAARGSRERTMDLSESRPRLNQLKRDIALDRYAPDSGEIADAILTKLQLVRRARRALGESGAGQSPPASEGRHRGDH